MRPEGNMLKLVSLQYKTQLTEMEQRLNEARGEHAKAGEFVMQDSVNRNGTKIKWG